MRFRKLRIAWSVLWGISCLLLIVLWVRSYWWIDRTSGYIKGSHFTYIETIRGEFRFLAITPDMTRPVPWTLHHARITVEDLEEYKASRKGRNFVLGVDWKVWGNEWNAVVPMWLPTLICGAFAAFPWLTWHFGLRTLLIATTLVAVVLGLVVWVAKK